jgi:DNA polymerase I-like protein with 3'-5' exonuclease and polymerase domains/intein/homing endonuclease
VDTETTGLDPHVSELLLLQVATTDKVYIVDCKRVVPLALKPILENANVLKIAQNAKFEYEMLKQQCGITLTNMYDTMLAERICTAGLGREISLKQIAARYVGAVLDKSVREAFYKLAHNGDAYLAPEQLHYAARDAFIMIPIWHLQKKELERHKLEGIAELEFQCIAAVGDLELAGVKIDVAKWRKIIEDVAVQRERTAVELSDMLQPATMQATMFGIPSINLNSSTQLMEVFSKLGVDLPDTSEATLSKFNHPAVAKLLEYRSHEKTLSAFGENVLGLINPRTGRIHPDFNQHGADTGRFSCTKPNVQQIPATSDFRKCFIATEGYKLITCVAEGTRVLTTRGLIPIEQVVVGDKVIQEDGSTRPVQRVIDQGSRPTLRLRTSLGYELVATPEHRVRVLNGEGDYVWEDVSSLREAAAIAIKVGSGEAFEGTHFQLPYSQEGHFNAVNRALPATVTEELALLLGYITGDGTFIKDYIGWVVNQHDTDVAEYLDNISQQLLSYVPKSYSYRGVIDLRVYSKQIRRWLESIGASKERVPAFLWSSSRPIVAAYLRGLFEADGSVQSTDTGKISYSTVHEELAREVQALLSVLGIAATRRKEEHGKGCGYIWFITIPSAWNKAFYQHIGFLSRRKRTELVKLLTRKVKQEHGAMPNLQAKARQLVQTRSTSRKVNQLLANTRNRGSVVTVAIAERVRAEAPEAARHLGLHHLLDNSILFDRVTEVSPAGVQHVYDLTIEGTSTYITQGFVSHNCDYSQAELRILAELSGDPGFVGAFQSGGDLHSLTASQMFNVPLEQVQKSQRSAAKAINFGLAYGMGPGGLAPRLGVTLDEAKELIARYFKAYPGVQQWLDKAARDAVRNGYSVTMLGRKRFYSMPDEGLKKINEDEWRKQIASIERQGKNSPIQGCVSGDTRIFEETRGYVPIASMRGEVVSVWDGSRFSQAVVVYSGKKQKVKVHLWDGNYIECSPDHRFLVRPTSGTDLWRTPAEFKPQQRVVLGEAVPNWGLPVNIPAHSCNGSWNAKDTSLSQISDPGALGEWLGRLASDGTVRSSTAALMVAEHEEVLLPILQTISAELGHVGHSIRSTESRPKRFHKLTVSSRGLAQQLHELGVKQRVPDCAWQDSRVLAGYLRGLFDGDGTVNRDGAFLAFGQRDKHLAWAREIQQALLLFGVRSRINICADRVNVCIIKKDMPIFCRSIGFMNRAKQAKAVEVVAAPRNKTYGRGVRVKSVEFTDEWIDMYDVVNSETHQFMANGLVVHNCNADMTKLALIYLRNALRDWDARTVNTVHDEIVVEARADIAEEVQHIVEDCMVRAAAYILKVVPMVAEASLADYWSK